MKKVPVLLLLAVVATQVPAQAPASEIIVSAAASLTDVLTALQPQAEAATGARLHFNFAGSGTLRQQIEQGAPVDVIFTAAAEDMDRLEKEGLIVPASRRDVLSNSMVLVGDASAPPVTGTADLRALLSKTEFLAIGNPDVVPAGRYAVQALKTYDLYSVVEKKLVLGNTVREVLQFVQTGSAPLGIVFSTDAKSVKPAGAVQTLYTFPDDALKTPVVYPVALVSASRNQAAAQKMIDFLRGSAARDAFAGAGFILK